jgi:hypothetical protein
MVPTPRFTMDSHARRCILVSPGVLRNLHVSACKMLCFDSSVIGTVAALQPKLLTLLLLNKEVACMRSTVLVQFLGVSNFKRRPSFPSHHDRNDFFLLTQSARALGCFPLADMRELDSNSAENIRNWADRQGRQS